MKRFTAEEMRVRANYEEYANMNMKTARMLRQAADDLEREEQRAKGYEYAVEYIRKRTGKCVGKSASHFARIEDAKRAHTFSTSGEVLRFVRREVGEWEEVDRNDPQG